MGFNSGLKGLKYCNADTLFIVLIVRAIGHTDIFILEYDSGNFVPKHFRVQI